MILRDGDKLNRGDIWALVQMLEKGMLGVCAFCTPNDGARGFNAISIQIDGLAIRLHLQLLQELRQETQALGIGNNGAAFELQAGAVPPTDQTGDNNGVFCERQGLE